MALFWKEGNKEISWSTEKLPDCLIIVFNPDLYSVFFPPSQLFPFHPSFSVLSLVSLLQGYTLIRSRGWGYHQVDPIPLFGLLRCSHCPIVPRALLMAALILPMPHWRFTLVNEGWKYSLQKQTVGGIEEVIVLRKWSGPWRKTWIMARFTWPTLKESVQLYKPW